MANDTKVPLLTSRRERPPGSKLLGTADGEKIIEISLRLRPRARLERDFNPEKIGMLLPKDRRHASRELFAVEFGADRPDVQKIEEFARTQGLEIVSDSSVVARRLVRLRGKIREFQDIFSIELREFESPDGSFRGWLGPLFIPRQLADIIEGVFGLSDRRQARPHIVLPDEDEIAFRATIPRISFPPSRIAQFYDFPSGLTGEGQCVGIVEFGGGLRKSDIDTYFHRLGLPVADVTFISVGAGNSPGEDPEADGEVALDVEVVGAIAPGAKIVVYFAPFSEKGWVDALTAAVHDSVHKPSVLSISWGWPERSVIEGDIWTTQALHAVNGVLREAAALGMTVCVASGDDGSADQLADGRAHVDFPAFSPYSLGCGGTTFHFLGGPFPQESVWNRGPRQFNGGASGGE